jgi:hypothetical protein
LNLHRTAGGVERAVVGKAAVQHQRAGPLQKQSSTVVASSRVAGEGAAVKDWEVPDNTSRSARAIGVVLIKPTCCEDGTGVVSEQERATIGRRIAGKITAIEASRSLAVAATHGSTLV